MSTLADEREDAGHLDVQGLWHCVEVLRGRAFLPGMGALDTESRIRSRVFVEQRGVEVDVTWRVEAIELESGTSLTRIEVDSESIAALSLTRRRGRIERAGVQPRLVLPAVTLEQRLLLRFRGLLRGTQSILQRTTTAFTSAPLTGPSITGQIDWEATRVLESTSNPLLRLAPTVVPAKGASYAAWTRVRQG
jgi:hypothetical protein